MADELKISEVERAVLHAGLCYLERHAREIGNVIELKYVAELRTKLYPELASQKQHANSVPAAPTPQAEEKQQVSTPAPRPQQQEHRSPLPPLNTYQPQAPASGQSGSGMHRISDKQSGRFYAIQKKSGKRPSEVTEKLKSLGFSNYKAITVDKYDELINWLQS